MGESCIKKGKEGKWYRVPATGNRQRGKEPGFKEWARTGTQREEGKEVHRTKLVKGNGYKAPDRSCEYQDIEGKRRQ